MAKTSSGAIAQSDYLKKYLSDGNKSKKKRKQKQEKVAQVKRCQIIDDDIQFIVRNQSDSDPEFGEDAPQVVAVIDERPQEIIVEEEYRKSRKWKTIAAEDDLEITQDAVSSADKEGGSHSKDSDPALRPKTNSDDSDQSLPRKCWNDSDKSPPRRSRNDSDSDESPPRRRRNDSDSDASPPRRGRVKGDSSSRRYKSVSHVDKRPLDKNSHQRSKHLSNQESRRKNDKDSQRDLPHETAKGNRHYSSSKRATGLQDAEMLGKDLKALRRQEDALFNSVADEISGRGAATIIRDRKTGRKRNFNLERQEKREKDMKKNKMEEKYREWGKGLKQTEMKSQQEAEVQHEMSKPLARYQDDADLDTYLRQQMRDGDPALMFLKNAKPDGSSTSKPDRPRYQGPPPPPNRFKIAPGYRWDGVDRSNGFEKDSFSRSSAKKAEMSEIYRWSVEDM